MQSQHFWPLPVCCSLLIQLLWGTTYRNFQRAACAQLELQDVAHMISTVSAVDEHVRPVELRVDNQPESDALPCCRAVWSGMWEKHPVCVLLEQKGFLGVCCQSPQTCSDRWVLRTWSLWIFYTKMVRGDRKWNFKGKHNKFWDFMIQRMIFPSSYLHSKDQTLHSRITLPLIKLREKHMIDRYIDIERFQDGLLKINIVFVLFLLLFLFRCCKNRKKKRETPYFRPQLDGSY